MTAYFDKNNQTESITLSGGKMKKTKFKISAAILAGLISCLTAVSGAGTAYASGPGDSGIPDGITAEAYAALSDNTIEWSEISDLIKYRNPTYKTYSGKVDETLGSMKNAAADTISGLKDQLDDIDDAVDSIKEAQRKLLSNGGSTTDTAYKKLEESLDQSKVMRKALKSGLESIGKTTRSLTYGKKNSEISLAPLKNQLTSVVEGLVISYKTLETNRTMAAEQVALYETLYGTYQSMEREQMATAQALAGYKQNLDSAKASLMQLDAGMAQLKANILVQCGYAPDADVLIAEPPKADRNYLSERDIDADRKTAIGADSSVKTAGKVSNYSGDVLKYRDANSNAAESAAKISFDDIYSGLKKQLILCDASDTSLRIAELTEASADTKNSLGMLGKGEYEGLKMQYIASRASAGINELNLLQATENYKYAVLGIMGR